jgi:hypothetical protein
MDFHELSKNTVSRLREMAKEQLPDLKGVSGMKKEQLLDALADKLGIEKPHKVVQGVDKAAIKAEIRKIKAARAAAVAAKDQAKMKETRERLHALRRQLRRATRVAA